MDGVLESEMASKPRIVLLNDAEIRAVLPTTKRQVLSVAPEGNSLFLVVEPLTTDDKGGGKSFIGRYRFPGGRQGKQNEYRLGVYGKTPGKITLRQAREDWDRVRSLYKQTGRDPNDHKKEERTGNAIKETGHTFEDVAQAWLNHINTASSGSGGVQNSTAIDYKNKVENAILPIFGQRIVDGIKRSECVDLKESIERRGALSQANRVFMVMRMIFDYAIEVSVQGS